jgi:hypothetical protein
MSTFGGGAVDIELINEISQIVKYGSTIVELGSGHGSTSELCKHYKLYSIEHDPKFIGLYNSNYIYAPLINDFWYDPNIVRNSIPQSYDLLLVDGPIAHRRKGFIDNYSIFNQSVPLILDDMQRTIEQDMAKTLINKYGRKLIKTVNTSTGKAYSVFK